MKVGDLVTVAPSGDGVYMIVSLQARDVHNHKPLPNCVMIMVPDIGIIPMHKGFITLVSEA